MTDFIKLQVVGYQTDQNGVKLYARPKDDKPGDMLRQAYHIEIDWKYLKGINFLDKVTICKFCNQKEIRYDNDFCSLECKQQHELYNKPMGWKWISLREKVEE